MNDNKLSTNLEKINVSVSDIRNTLDAQDVAIDDLSAMVSEVKTSLDELENNMVYQVSARDEMESLSGVEEGSVCLVKGTEIRPSNQDDKFSLVYFPETVTIPMNYTPESFSLYIADTGHGSLDGTLTGSRFDFPMIIKGQGSYAKNISYIATTEGGNYIFRRQDTYGSPVMSAGELSYRVFGNYACRFFEIEAELKEQYIYRNGGWEYMDPEEIEELNMIIEEKEQVISDLDVEIEDLNNVITEQDKVIVEQSEEIERLKENQGSGESSNGLYQVDSLEEMMALLEG